MSVEVGRDYEVLANKVMKAFVQYINDAHDWEEQRGSDHKEPKAIGCCARCGFTVYRSDGEMYHFSYDRGYQTRSCGWPELIEVSTR